MNIVGDRLSYYQLLTYLFVSLIVTGSIFGIIVPAGLGWDFANFYDAGRRILAGQINDLYSPLSLIGGEKPQGITGFWGAPISAYIYAPLGLFSPKWALIIFKIQTTFSLFATLVLLYFSNRRFIEETPIIQAKFAAIFAFISLIYQPFWTIFRVGGQTTPTVLLFLILSLLFLTSSRLFLSALFFALAVFIKPFMITALIFFLLISGIKYFKNTVIIFSFIGLISILVMGWNIHEKFLILMLEGAKKSSSWYYNSSLYVVFDNLRLLADSGSYVKSHEIILNVFHVGIKLAIVATFAFIIYRSWSQKLANTARMHFNFLMAISFCLLISQIVWEHYLTFLFLLLTYVVATHQYFSRTAKVLIGVIFFLSIWQNLIFINLIRYNFDFNSVPALIAIGIFKSSPMILTLIFICLQYKELFKSYTAKAWTT